MWRDEGSGVGVALGVGAGAGVSVGAGVGEGVALGAGVSVGAATGVGAGVWTAAGEGEGAPDRAIAAGSADWLPPQAVSNSQIIAKVLYKC